MEGLQKAFRDFSQDPKLGFLSSSSISGGGRASALSADQSQVLVTRPPRQTVSLWTCSKLCAICFVAGVVLGFTLKRRVRRWASKLLRRIRDD
ncbi:unnamed protein product [Camellia sinensis]|uniref:uncharacterized protein LOC114314478 n=1 Tax=Camellia sinensis TaxID=4442 RepID=UPI001035E6F6|nr:uncharacterized protein LOC114314478 [Camellia sinensis]